MKTRKSIIVALLAISSLGSSGCASLDRVREENPEPNHRLDEMMSQRDKARQEGKQCYELYGIESSTTDCQRLQREVDRLYAEYPEQERIMMANAVFQYEMGRIEAAQFLLDQLLSSNGPHPEAAILRAQIALSEGNITRARTLLQNEIQLAPDYAELHEALASAYYLEGQYEKAEHSLQVASVLGAARWRLAYHRGLISEAQNNPVKACGYYRDSILENKEFRPAMARMLGLSENRQCSRLFETLSFGKVLAPAAAD